MDNSFDISFWLFWLLFAFGLLWAYGLEKHWQRQHPEE